ncbi:MBOAT family O-acyltransferase [Butyrivibrio sp. MC2021]|uniref:MBOAT family O-acyltransferase n=1 Tax=Butyrivibrio sp. MC2021 TaxID=1408306 RepID=UPI000688B283|nr:MBOAT family O-acyltransferase [Butyrivibrio sp. MC2021]
MINFSDLTFIFRFLPVFLIAYYLTPIEFRMFTLLAGSLTFYAIGDLRMFPVLLGAVFVNFLFARAMHSGTKKKMLLAFIVFLDAVMLVEFKALSQFVDSSLMPIGISFYVFKMISFQADVYLGKVKEKPGFLQTATYFTLFPQVVSGPIMRFSDFERHRENRTILEIFERIEDGLKFFTVGLGMKVLLADHLAMLWKDIGTIGYESISTPLAWLGAVAYSLELYLDFWGYSLMAAGIGVMIGFPFIMNFDHPYASRSVAEFYRRWHASLGSWFRDYVYIPLGGSRKGTLRTIFNLLVVWLITGFWHGVTLNFILWGVLIFFIIICEKYIVSKLPGVLRFIIGKINVLVLIPLTWVIFAISDSVMLCDYFKRLFPFFGAGIAVNPGDFAKNIGIYGYLIVIGIVLLFPKVYEFFENHRRNFIVTILVFVLFWACVYSLSNAAGNPFMYFRF